MSIYDVDARIGQCFDSETGELINEEMYEFLLEKREDCVEQLLKLYKNELYIACCIKGEIQKLSERLSASKNKCERYKEVIGDSLGGKKFECGAGRVSYRNTRNCVIVDDASLVPDDYLRFKEPEVDKKKVKDAFVKDGLSIPGVHLEDRVSTVIY